MSQLVCASSKQYLWDLPSGLAQLVTSQPVWASSKQFCGTFPLGLPQLVTSQLVWASSKQYLWGLPLGLPQLVMSQPVWASSKQRQPFVQTEIMTDIRFQGCHDPSIVTNCGRGQLKDRCIEWSVNLKQTESDGSTTTTSVYIMYQSSNCK